MVREAVKFQFSDDFKVAFKRLLKKYRTLKQDLLKVMDEIQESPSEVGVPLFATVRKMRMAISAKGRGKVAVLASSSVCTNKKGLSSFSLFMIRMKWKMFQMSSLKRF